MSVGEHDGEFVPGLPAPLPPGERILWQGSPDVRVLARTVFHLRTVALYFGALVVLAVGGLVVGAATALGVAATLIAALAGLGLLYLLAWLTARTTIYTVTDRRVVMRFGIALSTCVNLPHRIVGTASALLRPDGSGDLALSLLGDGRMGWLHLWPHVRPWRVTSPEPSLRAIPDVARVGALLSDALLRANPAGRRLGVVAETAGHDLPEAVAA